MIECPADKIQGLGLSAGQQQKCVALPSGVVVEPQKLLPENEKLLDPEQDPTDWNPGVEEEDEDSENPTDEEEEEDDSG